MIIIGYSSERVKAFPSYQPIYKTHNSSLACFLLYIFFCLEFIINNGVPLLMYDILDLNYDYTQFGIKTLHPLILTFTSFYTVLLFHRYISTKSRKLLIQVILLSLYPILIMNRGAFFLNLTSMLMVYLLSLKHIDLRKTLFLFILILIAFYLFGAFGDFRTGGVNILLSSFEPSDAFISSNIPNEFLWPYLYITSPLGNLQETINYGISQSGDVFSYILNAIVPDFISKNLDFQPAVISRIAPFLTVGGIYSSSYVVMGYIGMVFTFVSLVIFILLYLFFLPRNTPYTTSAVAILGTLIVFNTFDNMIVFSGLSFQLIYPFIMGFAHKINFSRYLRPQNNLDKIMVVYDEVKQ